MLLSLNMQSVEGRTTSQQDFFGFHSSGSMYFFIETRLLLVLQCGFPIIQG